MRYFKNEIDRMSKKEVKNNYAENIYGDPSNYSWGRNIWGKKMSMLGLVLMIVVGGIVIYADSKGLIDWQQQSESPLEVKHPHFEETSDTLK